MDEMEKMQADLNAAKAKAKKDAPKSEGPKRPVVQADPATSAAPKAPKLPLSKAEQKEIDKAKAAAKKQSEKEAAAKLAAKVKAAGEKAAEKVKKEEEKKAKDKAEAVALKQANVELTLIGKEVLARMQKIAKLEGDADDHRLAAALRLADAKKICEANKIKFQDWSDEHADGLSFETVRKLAAVGGAENPKLALADMRGKNKEANKKARDKAKTENKGRHLTDEEKKEDDFKAPKTQLERTQDSFLELSAANKVKFLAWAVDDVGGLKLVAIAD